MRPPLFKFLCLLVIAGTGRPALSQDAAPSPAKDSTQVVALEDLDPVTRMAAIDTLIGRKKYKTAKLELQKWIESEPMNDTIRIKLAGLYESKKYFQEAADIYEKLVYINPQNKSYIRKTIILFAKMRYYTVSIKYCDRYLAIDPDNIPVLEKKAELLSLEGKYNKSIKTYQAILDKAKHRDDIRLKLARDLGRVNKHDQAVNIYLELANTSPDNLEYQRQLCFALYHNGQYQEAEKVIRRIMRRSRRDFDVIDTYCNILAKQQRYTEAINYYYRLLQSDPMDPQIKWKIAQIYAWKGDYFIALSLYDQILRTGNVPPEILRERARVLGWAHRYDASLRQYEKILETHPQDTLTRIELQAKKAYYNHRYSNSISQYNKLIDKDAANWDARLQLAQLYSSLKRWDQGRTQYQQIIKTMPTFERVKVALNKLNILAKQVNGGVYTEYNYAKSGNDYRLGKLQLDREVYTTHLTATTPPLKDLYLSADYALNRYHFDGRSDRTLQDITLSGVLYKQPPLWISGAYTMVLTPEKYDNLNLFRIRANYRLLDLHQFTAGFGQEQFYPNPTAFRNQLLRQRIYVDYRLQVNSRFGANLQYANLAYNDSLENKQHVIGANIKYGTKFQRAGISFTYGLNFTLSEYDSDIEDALYYFSPNNFTETYFVIDWNEFLKGNDVTWGDDKVYYNLQNTFKLDKDVIFTDTFKAMLNLDFSPRMNLQLGGLFEYSTRHIARQAYGKGSYYF